MKTQTLLKKTHFQCVTNMFSIKQCWKLICVRPQCVCERTLRSLQWSGFCLVSNSFEFSKFSSFSHTLFSQAFIWEGMASISGQRSLNPKSIDCLHKIPFGHSSTDQIFCLVFFVTLWSLIQHSASKATDHQIYILWDLFDLDNKTLLFFLLLFIGHPCLKAFPLCVCLIQLGFNGIDFTSQAL